MGKIKICSSQNTQKKHMLTKLQNTCSKAFQNKIHEKRKYVYLYTEIEIQNKGGKITWNKWWINDLKLVIKIIVQVYLP